MRKTIKIPIRLRSFGNRRLQPLPCYPLTSITTLLKNPSPRQISQTDKDSTLTLEQITKDKISLIESYIKEIKTLKSQSITSIKRLTVNIRLISMGIPIR